MAINNSNIIERHIKATQEDSIIKSNTLLFFIVRNTTQNNESSVRRKNIVRGMLRQYTIGNMYNLHPYAHKPEAKDEHTKTIRPSVILLSLFLIINITTILDHRGQNLY